MYIENTIQRCVSRSEFGAVDLQDICRICLHVDITREEVEQYIATLIAQGRAKSQIVGRAYYVTLTNT